MKYNLGAYSESIPKVIHAILSNFNSDDATLSAVKWVVGAGMVLGLAWILKDRCKRGVYDGAIAVAKHIFTDRRQGQANIDVNAQDDVVNESGGVQFNVGVRTHGSLRNPNGAH